MSKQRRTGVAAVMLAACSLLMPAAEAAPTPAAYLRQGIGARSMGMGHAFVGAADDSTALFWNPAGIGSSNRIELSTSHANLTEERKHDNVAFSYPGRRFGLAAGYIFFGMEGIPHTELDTSTIIGYRSGEPVYDVKTIGYFDDRQHALAFGGSYRLKPQLRIGGGFKLLSHKILDKSATGYAFDLGALWSYNDDLSLGASFRNLLGTLEWNTSSSKEEPLDVISSFGASYRIMDSLAGNLDIFTEGNNRFDFRLGAEWRPLGDIVALRAGLDRNNISLGAGLSMEWWTIDYAFSDRDLGDLHRLSVNLSFDRNIFKRKPPPPEATVQPVPPSDTGTIPAVPEPPAPAAEEPQIVTTRELIARSGDYLIANTPIIRLYTRVAGSGNILVEAPFLLDKCGLLSTLNPTTGLLTVALQSKDARDSAVETGVPTTVQMELGSVNALVNQRDWVVMQAAPEVHRATIYLPLEDISRLFRLPLTKATTDIYR